MLIELGHGLETEIDDADAPFIVDFKWRAVRLKTGIYAAASKRVNGKPINVYLHRLLLGFPKGQTDHHDGNTLNNTRKNLRLATPSQNQANRRKMKNSCTSVYKGVSFKKSHNKWVSRIGPHGKHFLGYFSTQAEAANAYNAAALTLYDKFAKTN